ncbi:unnamed protein product [Nippostrongylus brasiliensis]|uniref:Phosphoglycerate mutase family protein n=1 Tax=Nippostrongylus brasiliensis TaxID=27835 RepID=A0A0N4YCP2_NIPBR|nr:hypothetical protein Q1695_003127 [Nippostrongylus brasiliensis]VDL77914.1 unnamed protein product [Nippostrongylus brasiliensis]
MAEERIIWIVRGAEREDNINDNWRDLPDAHGLTSDNSLLSSRGREQSREIAHRFHDVKLHHVISSPFDRTMETASIIVADKNLLIKPEPGLCEVLCECEHPPGFMDNVELKKKYHAVDTEYEPCYEKKTLPEEKYGHRSCVERVRSTLRHITENYDGDLLLVSHSAPIAAIHQICGYSFKYVGQATVTKFVEDDDHIKLEYSADASHLSQKDNLRPY